jgi:ABC-type multidrug transport system ATPase subunit
MKDYEPRNFSSKIVFREQDASSITIGSFTYRQLFDNEPDDKVIDHFMELCGLSKTKYDEKIDPTINGGQKSCLMMATRVHYVVKNEIKFFIMDEPECAMNVETSIPVLKRVFNELSGVTILLITHLRDDEVKQLTTWTTHLHIKRMNETMSMISSI